MKKNYIAPTMQVLEFKMESQLMAASSVAVDKTGSGSFDTDASGDYVVNSIQGGGHISIWGEDE